MAVDERNPWELAQENLKTVLEEHSYENWFSQTRFESLEDGKVVVQVPSAFFASWLRDHYLDAISESLREVLPGFREVAFNPARAAEDPSVPKPGNPQGAGNAALRKAQSYGKAQSEHSDPFYDKVRSYTPRFNGFNPKYTFDRFVIGSSNRFAHAAARAVAESPGRAYNPLFLYGGTGLGKTHLMQAIGQDILEQSPGARIVFISSEQFTNQLIESIAKKSTQRFRSKYRKVDVLLIDDIHFIAGKEATQEEFFHTFNELFDMHKQIVLSSDRGPKDIQGLEERLVSRFKWGLVTDLQPPDIETRVAILQNKAAEEDQPISPDVTRYIAESVTRNIRELEGALITVLAYSKLTQQAITIDLVEEVLHDLIGRDKIHPLTIDAIQRAVADHFDLRISDLRGQSRTRQVAYPRQMCMFLCKDLIPSLSLSEIGQAFGGKDHTTVIHACKKIRAEKEKDETTRQLLSQLEKATRT